MNRTPRLATALGAFLSGIAATRAAHAHGSMIANDVFEMFCALIGLGGLVLSAILGGVSWYTALRPPKTVGMVFGRGFLGVSAIVTFALSGLFLTAAFFPKMDDGVGWFLTLVVVLVLTFFAVEFLIAATLYRRSNTHKPSTTAKVLSIVSYVIGGLFVMAALLFVALIAFVNLVTAVAPTPPKRPDSEVRRYQKGCDEGDASDCNMLGLRYQAGSGVARDPEKALHAFARSCDLGASIGCSHAASMHSKGDGVPQNKIEAEKFQAREQTQKSQGK